MSDVSLNDQMIAASRFCVHELPDQMPRMENPGSVGPGVLESIPN